MLNAGLTATISLFTILGGPVSAISIVIVGLAALFIKFRSTIFDVMRNIVNYVLDGVESIVSLLSRLPGPFRSIGEGLETFFESVRSGILNTIDTSESSLDGFLTSIPQKIKDTFAATAPDVQTLNDELSKIADVSIGERLVTEISGFREALKGAATDVDELNKRITNQNMNNVNSSRRAGEALRTIFEQGATFSRRAFRINQGIQIANAIIDTHAGVAKALSASAPPLNFLQAAAVLTQGLASVATIRSQSFQGLQTGGLVTSSGGFVVGERGPEIVNLPAGSAVIPNEIAFDESRNMSGGGNIIENVNYAPNITVGAGVSQQAVGDAIRGSFIELINNGLEDTDGSGIARRERAV